LVLILIVCWLVIVAITLAVCRAAGRADEQTESAAFHCVDKSRRTTAIGLVTAATVLASTSAAPRASARSCPAPDGAAPAPELVAAVNCRIAALRADRDLHRLTRQRQLVIAARRYAGDMAQRDFFSHVSPEGGRLRDRLIAAGYVDERCSWHVGEVLAWRSGSDASAAWTVRAWMHSPPHRQILLGDDYDEIGIGIAQGAPVETEPGVTAITASALLGRHDCPA
jgi:uncharacterized protein YkwD